MLRPFTHVLMLLLVSCQSKSTSSETQSTNSSIETLDQMNQRLQNQRTEEEKRKADFASTHHRYRCEESEVPEIQEATGPGRNFRSMQFGENLVLKLQLGGLIRVNGEEFGPMRTKSRYHIFVNGKQRAEAESLFSISSAVGDEITSNRFIYNPASNSLLVFDDLCWSTKRYILFEQAAGGKWGAKYFWPPSRPVFGSPVNHEGKIRGIGNGKIYVEIDGHFYAFPVENYLVKNLEFTVG
jgi:hypothetical protein|uniref:hypothetical protein n=1 Tax=Prosthecobacter sp. TaxID=1965333 RepID=UPI003783ED31